MRKGFGMLALLALSACATVSEENGEELPVAEPVTPVAPVTEPSEPLPPPPLPDPDTLLNKRPADIVTLLGEPDLVRWENNAQILQYRAQSCVLDLVFFEQADGGFILRYYDSRKRLDGAADDAALCLDGLLKARS